MQAIVATMVFRKSFLVRSKAGPVFAWVSFSSAVETRRWRVCLAAWIVAGLAVISLWVGSPVAANRLRLQGLDAVEPGLDQQPVQCVRRVRGGFADPFRHAERGHCQGGAGCRGQPRLRHGAPRRHRG